MTGTTELIAAAKTYIAAAHAYDGHCEKAGAYREAEKDGVEFSRQTRTPAFVELEQIIAGASQDSGTQGKARAATIIALTQSATRLKKIASHKKSALFTAAERNYRLINEGFKAPDVKTPLSVFIQIAEDNDKTLQTAASGLRAAFDELANVFNSCPLYPESGSSATKPDRAP